jgi:hypothetical protein
MVIAIRTFVVVACVLGVPSNLDASEAEELPLSLAFTGAHRDGVPDGWSMVRNEGEASCKVCFLDDCWALTVNTKKGHARFEREVSIPSPKSSKLSWDWRVHTMPDAPRFEPWDKGGRTSKYQTNSPVQMLVVFRRGFDIYVIHYLWEPTVEVGFSWPEEETAAWGLVKLHYQRLVVRTGKANMDQWHSETANVVADFKKLFPSVKEVPDVIRIAVQCNSTYADGASAASSASVANITLSP